MRKFFIYTCIMSLLLMGVPSFAGTISETGVYQRDLVRFLSNVITMVNEIKADFNLLRSQNLNQSFTLGTLATGGESTAKTTTTIYYMIDGLLYSLAASASLSHVPTAAQSTPTYCYYLFSLNSSGVLTVTKGTEAAATASLVLPSLPASSAPIGYMLAYASSTAFTMGTSSLGTNVLGSTPTFYNLGRMTSGSTSDTAISASDLSLVNP